MHNYAVYRISPQDGSKQFVRIVRAVCEEQAENALRNRMTGCYEAHKITDQIEAKATAE